MSMQALLDDVKGSWLSTTGDPCTYHSARFGLSVQAIITIEKEVEVQDSEGMFVRHTMAFLSHLVVPSVTLGDTITVNATGQRWTVQEQYEDNGTFMSLYVRDETI